MSIVKDDPSWLSPIYSADSLPQAQPYRVGRKKYPWDTLEPGQWFQFNKNVTATSARVQATNRSNSNGFQYRVFRGVDDHLYCQRVDNTPEPVRNPRPPKDEHGQTILPTATTHSGPPPAAREVIPVVLPGDDSWDDPPAKHEDPI